MIRLSANYEIINNLNVKGAFHMMTEKDVNFPLSTRSKELELSLSFGL
jgi:hypothetical protein